MVAVIQRVKNANVKIDGVEKGKIAEGLLVLLGAEEGDVEEDACWVVNKILQMRIFSDSENKMNHSLINIKGEILLISQFTLLASTKKGNRPSFTSAAKPEIAKALYEKAIKIFEKGLEKSIQTGVFGADMQVGPVNDGPVTIIVNSRNRK